MCLIYNINDRLTFIEYIVAYVTKPLYLIKDNKLEVVGMKRFLIIEDNKVMAQILAQLLRKCVQPQAILHAATVQSAHNALVKTEVDCVFLDLNLSAPLDGIPILEYIRKQYPTLPVVIVTGDSEIDTVKQVISHKPADYMVKPLSLQKLQDCLTKIQN